MNRPTTGGRLCALILGSTLLLSAPATLAAEAAPFVMGTDAEEGTLLGKWYRRIYGEAFRRLGLQMSIVMSPTARLTTMADEGEIHGQPTRVFAYADTHPNQLRVEESLHDVQLALYAFDPASTSKFPKVVDELRAGKWMVEYRRGVAICERFLKPVLPTERLSDVTSPEQGLKKLQAGRTDLYCDFDFAVNTELLTPAFKGITGYRMAVKLGDGMPLYPYVHKSRADLVPKLADTLKRMKAEGLIDRYLIEVKRELEAAR